jgi:hypothetical protein
VKYACVAGAVVLALLPGCGQEQPKVRARGQLLDKGQPLKVSPKTGVTIGFFPTVKEEGKRADSYTADFNREDSTFVVPGVDGRGIPPGKYRITIMQMSLEATPAMNALNEAFGPEKSPIVRDVQNEEPIRIDLSKPEG